MLGHPLEKESEDAQGDVGADSVWPGLPLTALWQAAHGKRISSRQAATLTALAAPIGAVVFVVLNPYHLLRLPVVLKDISHTVAMHPMTMRDPALLPVGLWLLLVAGGPGLLVAGGAAVFRVLPSRRRKGLPVAPALLVPAVVFVLTATLLAAASTASESYLAENSRFFLLVLPEVIVVALALAPRSRVPLSVVTIAFLGGGMYVAAQHVAATGPSRPRYLAAAWIEENVPHGGNLFLTGPCAPFRNPPLDVNGYRIRYIFDRALPPRTSGWTSGYVVSSRAAEPAFGPAVREWSSP